MVLIFPSNPIHCIKRSLFKHSLFQHNGLRADRTIFTPHVTTPFVSKKEQKKLRWIILQCYQAHWMSILPRPAYYTNLYKTMPSRYIYDNNSRTLTSVFDLGLHVDGMKNNLYEVNYLYILSLMRNRKHGIKFYFYNQYYIFQILCINNPFFYQTTNLQNKSSKKKIYFQYSYTHPFNNLIGTPI